MGAVRAEFVKLRRSLGWTVVVLLPVAVVLPGAANELPAGAPAEDGWHAIWLRAAVFHGLFPLAIGVGILASLVWRVEHRGGNWNALMSGPTSTLRIVAAKATVVAALAAVMQAVLLLAVIVSGKVIFALSGMLTGRYFALSALTALTCLPVAVLQSGLSMLMRSFTGPIAVAFLGAGAAVVLLLAEVDLAIFVIPYALATRATQLGTGTFGDTGEITSGVVASIAIGAAVLAAVLTGATTAISNRRDVRI